tara:strand:+ start:181 stop:2397 length:2217 start_codon:yes stop_codon:yes gene_type:complete
MTLQPLKFNPGVNRDTTSYTNEGGWFDIDKVRFRQGLPEKIGGWTKSTTQSFLGSCRALHPWVTLDFARYLGMGTSKKYYVSYGGTFYDITPIASVNSLNSDISVSIGRGVSTEGQAGQLVENDNFAVLDGVSSTGAVGSALAFTPADDTTLVFVQNAASVGEVGTVSTTNFVSVSVQGSGSTGETSQLGVSTRDVNSTDDLVFSAELGSSTILITVNEDHGASPGTFVTFSGVLGLGGAITAGVLNQEYEIVSVPTPNTFTFSARTANTAIQTLVVAGQIIDTPVLATALDAGDGGNTSVAEYQISVGLDSGIFGDGWGAGPWSRKGWGEPADINVQTDTLRLWSHDNFGETLLTNPRDGDIYYWSSEKLSDRSIRLSDIPGSVSAPTICKQVMTSEDRHVLAFGCDTEANPGVQDPLAIRFSDQESLTVWNTLSTNTAGELRLSSGSEIVQAVKTRQQIVVFTDTTLYAMQFLGPPFTFGISPVSENITIVSPNAAIAVNDNVFWMGKEEFFVYGGSVQVIPCTVKSFVFSDLNAGQSDKIVSALNSSESEVWWFYPSAQSTNNDRYVVYNYLQNVWYYGTLDRTSWADRGIFDRPLATSTDNYLYDQEQGFDDGSTSPASPIHAYIESSQIDIGQGDKFAFLSRVIPDLTFLDSTVGNPTATMTLKTRNFPGGNYLQTNNATVEKTASAPVEQFTNQVNIRLRGRSFAFRMESNQAGVAWRLGTPRVDIRPDGGR